MIICFFCIEKPFYASIIQAGKDNYYNGKYILRQEKRYRARFCLPESRHHNLFCKQIEKLYNTTMFLTIRDQTKTQKTIAPAPWKSARPRKSIINYYPKVLQIQITDFCNLECVFCGLRQSEYASGKISPKKEIDETILRWIDDDVLNNVIVYLTGDGEPLTSRLFWKFVEGKRPSGGLTFNTNGVLLTKQNRAKLLSYPKKLSLTVSLNACTPQTYARIMGKDVFRTVLNNITQLQKEIKKSGKNILLSISFAAIKENLSEMILLPDITKRIGSREICCFIAEHYADYTKGWFSSHKQFIRLHPALLKQFNTVLTKVEKKAIALGINIASPESNAGYWHDTCREVYDYFRINKDGATHACCRGPSPYTGNIKDYKSFRDIWNNQFRQQMRTGFLVGVFPDFCKDLSCSYWRVQQPHPYQITPWYQYSIQNLTTNSLIRKDSIIISQTPCIIKGTLTNTGRIPWDNRLFTDSSSYKLGAKLFKQGNERDDLKQLRSPFKTTIIKPNDTIPFEFIVHRNDIKKGDYVLVIDVVKEQSHWLEDLGNTPVRIKITCAS